MKKLLLILCIVLTLLSLCACGEAKEPTSDIPSSDSDTLPTFTKESTESINGTLGNSIANYSSYSCRLAECKDYIFHSYSEEFQITLVEKATGNSTPLPIYGINLSIYNHKLYYALGGEYYSYDLITGEITMHWIYDYKVPSNLLDRFFITDSGFVAVSSVPSVIYTMDFNGNLLSHKIITGNNVILTSPSSIAICSNNHYYFSDIPYLALYSMDIPTSRYAFSFGDGNIYRVSQNNDAIVQISCQTKSSSSISVPFVSNINGITNDFIYYDSKEGTEMLLLSTGEIQRYSSNYFFAEMSFTSDGHIYGMAIPSDTDFSQGYDYVYVRSKLDGSDMTILSN